MRVPFEKKTQQISFLTDLNNHIELSSNVHSTLNKRQMTLV